jgi:MFS family permease
MRADKLAEVSRQRAAGPSHARWASLGMIPWLAWGIWGISCLLGAGAIGFQAENQAGLREFSHGGLLGAATALLFCTPGALIVARVPRNLVGWIMCGIGLGIVVAAFAGEYGYYAAVIARGALPGGVFALWLGDFLGGPSLALVPLLFVVFPDGELPSRGWRPAVWLLLGLIVWTTVSGALYPRHLSGEPEAPMNPIGIAGAADTFDTVTNLALLYLLGFMLASLVALRRRWQQALPVVRQQLKWFGFGAVALLVTVGGAFLWVFGENPLLPLLLGFGSFTSCIAIAILRHHLYDIDRLISRTLTYGLLTTILALAYLGGVLALRLVFSPLTGQSNLAVAGSTLATAAIFQPARRRVQRLVDRRFNRRRYDAAVVIEQFSANLRQQVDLSRLTVDLLAVAEQTMQPTQVSLWLRPPLPSEPPLS